MKKNCQFLQMYLCRIRFREIISKVAFNMSTICINYQLKKLRVSLTRVTNDFLGILTHSFRSSTFRTSKLWWWTIETLLSRYDQIPKSRGFRSQEDGAHSSLVMKCGTFSESHSWVFLAPCDVAESCSKDQRRFLKCSRAQGNNAPTKMTSRYFCWFNFTLWSTKKRGLLPDSATPVQTITETGHCFLATTRDPSSLFLDQTQLFWVFSGVQHRIFSRNWKRGLAACHLECEKEESCIFGVVCQKLEQKAGVS